MPALNEERYVATAIASLLPEKDAGLDYEILVMDGGSRDATARIVELLGLGNPAIRLVANTGRTQAAAVNLAARIADPRSTVLLRADCHAAYPRGFVATCVEALSAQGSASVVVPMHTAGASCLQSAIAAMQNSRLGNGGSAHRCPGKGSRFVDHGHHAAFDRRIFLEIGGYDESFVANEDAEFDKRLVAAGHRIWMSDAAAITYYPRTSLPALARQYANYGAGRAKTLRKQGGTLRLRQMLPLVALAGVTASLLLGLAERRCVAGALLYVLACIGWGCGLAVRRARPCLVLSGLAAMTMHMSWAIGFCRASLVSTRPSLGQLVPRRRPASARAEP